MKARYSDAARADLDNILAYTAEKFPRQVDSLKQRIRATVERIEAWPHNARLIVGLDDVRVVPLLRYPFKIFYRVEMNEVVILHIHHVAQDS